MRAQDAVDKGWFRERPTIDGPPCLPIILATAQEVASAMAYLHDRGIIHGDLTGGSLACRRGFSVSPCLHSG